MAKQDYRCEIVSPMLLTGADGQTPELRAPSLKGCMRFWWRAVMAASDIGKMREVEGQIFGGVGKDEGRSKVIVRMVGSKELSIEKIKLLPHKEEGYRNRAEAITKGDFQVSLINQSDVISDKQLEALLFLTGILGGLGKRSRRGFGNFLPEGAQVSPGDILNYLNVVAGKKMYSLENGRVVLNNSPNSPAEYPYITSVEIGNKETTKEQLLVAIGTASHENCNPALGMAGKIEKEIRGKKEYVRVRLASPVFVSLAKKESGYIPVITTLNTVQPEELPNFDIRKQTSFKGTILEGCV